MFDNSITKVLTKLIDKNISSNKPKTTNRYKVYNDTSKKTSTKLGTLSS